VGFDQQLNSRSSAAILEGCRELRSWVQISHNSFLSI
jgi:hypothetical protein